MLPIITDEPRATEMLWNFIQKKGKVLMSADRRRVPMLMLLIQFISPRFPSSSSIEKYSE